MVAQSGGEVNRLLDRHKERNLLAHAPKALHDEVKADYTDMMYAENAEQVRKKRKAFLAKWRLRCRGVADSLEEAGERLRTPARGIQAPGEDPMRTTQRGNGGHAVLGLDGLGADHHAPRRWLANTRPSEPAPYSSTRFIPHPSLQNAKGYR